MRSDWMREYVSAKLVEIDEALRALDATPDGPERHEEREKLVFMGSQLMASLAQYSDQPNLN